MLIDTNQIVTKTQLRENLTEILGLIGEGEELMISDRGKIKARLMPVSKRGKTKVKSKKFMQELKKLREELSVKNPNFNSVKAIREMREEN